MYCTKCGKNISDNAKFCNFCGAGNSAQEMTEDKPAKEYKKYNKKKRFFFSWLTDNLGRIIIAVIIISVIIGGIYDVLNEEAIDKNNLAIDSFDKSGNYGTAKKSLELAVEDSYGDDMKINTLKNLAYVESTEGKEAEAIVNFKKALGYTEDQSFDYYLITGEIAFLEKKYNVALYNFEKALQINPNDFQINNSLGIYYLDMEDEGHTNYTKALTYFKKAQTNNDSEILKENMAINYFFLEQYDIALNLFLQLNYQSKEYLSYWIGLTYLAKEDLINGRVYLQKAVDSGMEVEQEITDFLNSDL